MRPLSLLLCLCLLLPVGAIASDATGLEAGGIVSFELRDGSIVSGEFLGIDAAGYRVRSPTLGVFDVPQSEVQRMQRGPPSVLTGADARADIAAMQRRLLADPEIQGRIFALQDDARLREALADPGILRALGAGDLEALRENAQFRRLLEHPGIRAIIERVEGTATSVD
ncbi:MAG: hypothetical protein EA400_03815 [Chromatiaceae bacterium]|nr:MAG: hypothetical protein EA400_03815 [Chromatiaceae bacterium]